MIYVERIWRGLQLGLDLYFLRLFFLCVTTPEQLWYWRLLSWLFIGTFMAVAMHDFLLLKDLLRKPKRRRGATAD